MLAASGRRVVVVTATDGAAGLASSAVSSGSSLAIRRAAELDEAARILGVSRLVRLGYGDSGLDGSGSGSGSPPPFAQLGVDDVAARLATILREEDADAAVGYDASGGYGHPDHVQVHRVTRAAAAEACTPILLEATRPRQPMAGAVTFAHGMRWLVPQLGELDPEQYRHAYLPRKEISSRVDVRRCLPQKRAAMRAHASQATADDGVRTIQVLLGAPRVLTRRILGFEWFDRVWDGGLMACDDPLLAEVAGLE